MTYVLFTKYANLFIYLFIDGDTILILTSLFKGEILGRGE